MVLGYLFLFVVLEFARSPRPVRASAAASVSPSPPDHGVCCGCCGFSAARHQRTPRPSRQSRSAWDPCPSSAALPPLLREQSDGKKKRHLASGSFCALSVCTHTSLPRRYPIRSSSPPPRACLFDLDQRASLASSILNASNRTAAFPPGIDSRPPDRARGTRCRVHTSTHTGFSMYARAYC